MSVDKHTEAAPVTLTNRLLSDLLSSAVEVGSGYWAANLTIQKAGEEASYHSPALFTEDTDWELYVEDREDGVIFTAKRQDFIDAAAKMPEHHAKNLTEHGYDAETADVWFQFALFGEIVYG
ncbi:MAG: hypothetical protein NXH70_02315 [Hyphomonas sp.]|nr:hypothetical protein [Hyphomonas sp.]